MASCARLAVAEPISTNPVACARRAEAQDGNTTGHALHGVAPRHHLADVVEPIQTGLAQPAVEKEARAIAGEGAERVAVRQAAVRHYPLSEFQVTPDVGVPQRGE